MLFDIAALIYTSGSLGGVAEAFGVHEINQQIVSNVSVADPAVRDPNGFASATNPVLTTRSSGNEVAGAAATGTAATGIERVASTPRVDPAALPTLRGSALLDQFAVLPTSDLASFVKDNPGSVHKLIVNPPSAVRVGSWWSSLSSAGQKRIARTAPEVVGNLDGVPFDVRDAANRRYLAKSISTLEKSIASGIGRGQLVESRHHLDVLKQIDRTLVTKAKEPKRQLLTFDPTGEARAAVVVGDLSTADYVSYLVPGMFFTVQGQMYDWTVIARDLQSEQKDWLTRLSATDPSLAGKTSATVAWIGYTTPDVLDIASLDKADQGAKFLGSAVDGIQTVRKGDEPYVTLITHSYGSTAAMIELAKGAVSVDALAMIGSPGGAAQAASQLSVTDDRVFVGEAAWDPVVNTAFYGSDPGAASFGARSMGVAGGTDAVTHKSLASAIGHLGYFDPGTEAMRNLALIGIGQDSLVTGGSNDSGGSTLASSRK